VAIDPAVQEGLSSYESGDYHAAHRAWERRGAETSGDHHALLSALADLAMALERRAAGTDETSRLTAVRESLEDLPAKVLGVDVDRLRSELADAADGDAASASGAPAIAPAPLVPRWVLVRFLVFVGLIAAGFVLIRFTPLGAQLEEYLDKERLLKIRGDLQEQWWTGPVLLLLYAVLAPLGAPVSPLMFAAGAIFGTLVGAGYNFLGTFIGAANSYFLARGLGRDLIVHVAGNRLKKAERLIARRGFWPLVRTRFLPIPFPVVNYGAALGGVPAGLFLLTTAIGLVPANLVYTYFASALVDSVGGDRIGVLFRMGLAVVALLSLSFVPNLLTGFQRRKRLRELQEMRANRDRP
jgi:uncharacterized membrane protein YdjX (TVP38/TMEM64 family)